MKSESLNDLNKGQTEFINELYESEAKYILDEHFTQRDDNELLERIRLNIRNFSKLITNGVEIYPTLNVPEKIQNLFPNFNQLNTVSSKGEKLKDVNTVSSKEEKLKDVKIKTNKSFVLSKNQFFSD